MEITPIAYDPATDSWRELAAPPIERRQQAASVWTGTEWIVWGGTTGDKEFDDGAAYDPTSDTWRPLPDSPLSPRRVRGAWTGTELIVVAGSTGGEPVTGNGEFAHADGAAYDPATDTWRSLTSGPAHPGFVPMWTGSQMIMIAKGAASVYDVGVRPLDRPVLRRRVRRRWRGHARVDGVGGAVDRQQRSNRRRREAHPTGAERLGRRRPPNAGVAASKDQTCGVASSRPSTSTGDAVSRRGVLRCALAAVLFGVSAPLASRLAGEMGAFTLAGLLYLGAALAVVPVAGRAIPSRAAVRRSGRRLAVAVVVGGAVGPVLFATGLADAAAATASLLLNLELVFTTIVAATFFREHVDGKVVTGTHSSWSRGVAGLVRERGTALGSGADRQPPAVLGRRQQRDGSPRRPRARPTSRWSRASSQAPPTSRSDCRSARCPAASDVARRARRRRVGYGVSITLWVAGARDLGAARAQLVFATAPFIGAAVAWTVLGDAATGWQVSSLVIALVGVTFVLGSDHEHDHAHHAVEHAHEHRHDDRHHEHTHDDAEHRARTATGTSTQPCRIGTGTCPISITGTSTTPRTDSADD